MLNVAIVYETPGGRPLRLAMIENRELLRYAAAVALTEAREKVQELIGADPNLALIQKEEVEKLGRILDLLSAADEDLLVM